MARFSHSEEERLNREQELEVKKAELITTFGEELGTALFNYYHQSRNPFDEESGESEVLKKVLIREIANAFTAGDTTRAIEALLYYTDTGDASVAKVARRVPTHLARF